MRITQGVRRAVQTRGRELAASFNGRRHTWIEFSERVSRLAGAFRKAGIATGDRVAVLMQNSDRYFECYAAIPWADCIIVPINTRWSQIEIQDSLRDCRAALRVH